MEMILREANTKDLRNAVNLYENLAGYESDLCGVPLKDNRRETMTETMAQMIASPDAMVLVADKSGRLVGFYVACIDHGPFDLFDQYPCCVIWLLYAKKGPNILKVHNRIKEWAEERECKSIRVSTLLENERTLKLFEKLGYNKRHISLDKEV